MLVKGYPFEMQGRLAEAAETCAAAVEIGRLSGNAHYLFWALFELGWARYYAGDLDGAIEACEESRRVGGRLTLGTMPSAGGGLGWALAAARFEIGEPARALELVAELGDDTLAWAIPVERCFNWETIALAELAMNRPAAAAAQAERAERTAQELDLRLPAAVAARTRAAALARALAAAGDRSRAIAEWRAAERELDACGSVRARDEVRRELRRLGARAEPRGPASAEDTGVGSVTKRELEIASLVTDRLTNRQIAATLFRSDKTIESHVRNIFMKLGVSSRVDVARAFEQERRRSEVEGTGAR
jgi:DNA-binding CsgD family transcriptional regulator